MALAIARNKSNLRHRQRGFDLDFSLIAATPGFFAFGVLATFIVAISKSGFGGAMGALSLPVLLIAMPPGPALAVLLPVFLLCDFFVGWKYRHHTIRRLVVLMFAAACAGQLLGWLLYKQINEVVLLGFIGGLALFTGGRYFYRLLNPLPQSAAISRHALRVLRRRSAPRAGIWCGLSGLASFISLTGGIPAQVYLLPLQLPRMFFIGTMGWYFLLINVAKLPFYIELGLFDAASLTASLVLAPLVPLGVFCGIYLNRKMSDAWFYHIAHGFLLILGGRLIFNAIA